MSRCSMLVIAALCWVSAGLWAAGCGACGGEGGDAASDDSALESWYRYVGATEGDEAAREEARRRLQREEALARAVAEAGLVDLALVDAELGTRRRDLLLRRHMEAHLAAVVTDAAVERFYRENLGEWEQERILLRHILIRVASGAPFATEAHARSRADEAWSAVVGGEPFEEVAERMSDDRITSRRGGEMDWATRDRFPPEFAEAVFALERGELSEPFRTSHGFHVVRVEDGPELWRAPLEQVEGEIRHRLRSEARAREMERLSAAAQVEER